MQAAVDGLSWWWSKTQDGKRELLQAAKKEFSETASPDNLKTFLAICQTHRTPRTNSLFPNAETSSFSTFKKALPQELKKQIFPEAEPKPWFNIWGNKKD